MELYIRDLAVVLNDGSRSIANLQAEETIEGGRTVYKVSVAQGGEAKIGESEDGFFDALRKARLELEKAGVLLCCFGASENVYPSGMQESMGPATLVYKTYMGRQALSKDIVVIFDSDDTVRPATVDQQKIFHENWVRSL